MTLREKIEIAWIRYGMHPFFRDPVLPFKESIGKAKSILILYPMNNPDTPDDGKITGLFPAQSIVALFPGRNRPIWKPPGNVQTVFLEMNRLRLFGYRKNPSLNRIARTRFDVLIDLSLRPTTLGPYLCRLAQSPLRICLGMDEVKDFYNLHYNGTTPAGLYKFLKKIMNS